MRNNRKRSSSHPPLDLAWRWWIEVRPPNGKWTAVGTAGTRAAAAAWLVRFAGRGGVRVQRPPALVASLAAEG
jgi:hypothetical protein